MFGSRTRPMCKLKAAETKWFTRFLVDLLKRLRNKVPEGERAHLAGNLLLEHLDIMDRSPLTMDTKAVQDTRP
eukprot:3787502-Alexandrium_andersonii.AAC.1